MLRNWFETMRMSMPASVGSRKHLPEASRKHRIPRRRKRRLDSWKKLRHLPEASRKHRMTRRKRRLDSWEKLRDLVQDVGSSRRESYFFKFSPITGRSFGISFRNGTDVGKGGNSGEEARVNVGRNGITRE
ncbi:hypothetical protein HO173_003151 [Letharia columbiana]|uniref:Uncharacterized protein n=1 Tax=Letharia columbiana TaxID=112416 RepID=A0A8H6G1J5_9LECA|nr:uncharacterized protein HO173_003151 [Letharia columbiana]KAF6238645.1 hypothetical protein HO173_003151 [Letharia columbiana]